MQIPGVLSLASQYRTSTCLSTMYSNGISFAWLYIVVQNEVFECLKFQIYGSCEKVMMAIMSRFFCGYHGSLIFDSESYCQWVIDGQGFHKSALFKSYA